MARLLRQYLHAWAASLCLIVAAALALTILAATIALERAELPEPRAVQAVELNIPGGVGERPEPRPRITLLGGDPRPLEVGEIVIPRRP